MSFSACCMCSVYINRWYGLLAELPYGWEKVEDPHYGVYYIEWVYINTYILALGGL